MSGKKTTVKQSGETVATNIARLRTSRNISFAQLSRTLAELGCEIPELGLRNIEKFKRRIDVDELIALAVALETNPAFLLMPFSENANEVVESTANGESKAGDLWAWLTARHPWVKLRFNSSEIMEAWPRTIPAFKVQAMLDAWEGA